MISRHLHILPLCGWLCLPFCLAFYVSVAQSEESEQQRDYQEQLELEQLSDALSVTPDDVELNYRYAKLAGKLESYEKAIAAYERMLIVNPDLHRIKLDLATLYLKIGSDIEAKRLFEEVLTVSPPPQVKKNIEKMLAYIAGRERKHFLSASYTLGYNVDSNQNTHPKSNALDIFGVSIPIDGENNKEGQLISSFNAGHSYVLPSKNKHRWNTQASHTRLKQDSSRAQDATVFNVTTGPTFYSKDKRTQAGVLLGYGETTLAHQDYLKSFTKEAFIRYLLTPTTQVSAKYTHASQRYRNSDTVTTYEDRNGCTQDFELQLRTLLSPKDVLSVTGTLAETQARVAYETNRSKALNINYTRILPKDFFLTANALYQTTDYEGADALVNPDEVRRDSERTFTIGLGKNITDNISCALQFQRRYVDSNIQNYEYDNDRIMASVTWRY